MRFSRLRVTNIGAFYGSYEFDLSTKGEKNVVLFGGQNGSGKTTLLEAIRLALFGPLAYGFKTESAAYLERVSTRFNNTARATGEQTYRVILDLELIEDFTRNTYTVRRSWKTSNTGILEDLTIERNGFLMTAQETEIFQEKLREENPPHLLELCLFDGEKISQVVNNNDLPDYLHNAARVLFNLDLFENLETDLSSLVKQGEFIRDLTDEEKSHQDLLDKEEQIEVTINTSYERLRHLALSIQEMKSALTRLNEQFEVFGGLRKEQRDSLLEEMRLLDRERLLMMQDTKDFITNLLPFVLVRDLLRDVQHQVQDESEFEILEQISQLITPEAIKEALSSFRDQQVISLNVPGDQVASMLSERLLPKPEAPVNKIHFASFKQRSELELLLQKIQSVDPDKIRESFKKNSDMIKSIQKIRASIDENDSSHDIRILFEEMNNVKREIEKAELEKQEIEAALERHIIERSQIEMEKEQLRKKILSVRKAQNIYSITQKVQELSVNFRKLQLAKKLSQVEKLVTAMLQSLFRKEFFVVKVTIDPESMDMKLYGSSNNEINKEFLSAGEKHILLLATVWAMVECSNRQVPFVFDTLLGRLDQKHKRSIINNFIPRCGEQVIVLSTDSEIDADHFPDLQPRVFRAYTIDHDVKNSRVHVQTDHYFDFSKVTEAVL